MFNPALLFPTKPVYSAQNEQTSPNNGVRTMNRMMACVTFAIWMSACSGSTSPTAPPMQPAPVAAAVPRVAHVLSGVVFEVAPAGRVPLQNVFVYCDGCGSETGHTQVFTDAEGFYSFGWTYDGINPLQVSKEGYRLVKPTLSSGIEYANAAVSGDTRFDIELARR
jgi:hypothetical protein